MNIDYLLKQKKGDAFYSVAPSQSLTDAVAIMMEKRIGSVVVVENDSLQGILTERDIMRLVNDQLNQITTLTVADAMTPDPITCTPEIAVDEAMETMMNNRSGYRIRHLPVIDGDALVGLISIGDIIGALLTETRFENNLLKNYIKNWPEEENA